ncbi:MAG: AAA family ATPase [Candidatus Aminicenantes bacterium]|nr:AAA family ATPase [Candidatus Aminicenantes bacterium]NIM83087.1 AAA family ATPase [Candidatus Aminicenantes bacterium]NIN22466.1 AAA family ATPase [Candidatus Aminicenantes bacterium]NIN46234.1 AAA family ATPase [Candidatus Aminicenantes bacterium]NIN89071.1 AAA family ATPase [Candidatus Aminicenantes bacterium]
MKVKKLEVKAFRGFLDVPEFSLDGDIILLAGSNGLGKTTFCDAFEWCLTGKLKRYEESRIERRQHPYIVNRFANREAFVKISFFDGKDNIEFIREGDERDSEFDIRENGKQIPPGEVSEKKLEVLIADKELLGQIQEKDIEYLLLRSHLLEQELTAEFIRSVQPSNRFSQLSKILGADRFETFCGKLAGSFKFIDLELSTLERELKPLLRELEEKKNELEREKELSDKLTGKMTKESIYNRCSEIAQNLGEMSPNILRIDEDWLNVGIVEFSDNMQDYCKGLLSNSDKLLENVVETKADLSDIQVNYENIDRIIEEIKQYKSDLEEHKKNRNVLRSEKADIEKKLKAAEKQEKNLEESVKQPKDQLGTLIFLHKNLDQYQTRKNELDQLTSEINKIHNEISTQLNSLNNLKQEQEIKKSTLENYYRDIAELVEELKKWGSIKQKRVQLHEIETNSEKLSSDLEKLRTDFDKENESIRQLEIMITNKEKIQREISAEFNAVSRLANELGQLLGRLKVLIDSSICPLCGHEWETKYLLLDQVEKMSSKEEKLISEKKAKLSGIDRQISHLKQKLEERKSVALSLTNKIDLCTRESEEFKQKEEELIEEISLWELNKKKILDMENEFIEQRLVDIKEKKDNLDSNTAALKKDLSEKSKLISELSGQIKIFEINRDTKKKNSENLMTFLRDFEEKSGEMEMSEKDLSRLKVVLDQTEQKIKELSKKLNMVRKEKESILEKLRDLDEKIDTLEEKCESTKQTIEDSQKKTKEFSSKLRKFNLETYSQITGKLNSLAEDESKINRIIEEIKKLDESLGYFRGKARFEELSKDIRKLNKRLIYLEEKIENVKKSRELAQNLKNAGRRETRNVIKNLIRAYQPSINDFYRQVNPHPRFTRIRFVPKPIPGPGSGNAVFIEAIDDFEGEEKIVNPSFTFSSAQLNVLAISIFLAIHTKQSWSKLNTIFMDDPIQNMDDLNILSYIDLIRRIRKNKQIIITTHDEDIYRLMKRKFQPTEGEKLICYEFKSFDVNGPEILEYRFPA